ncbi:hypothetical protein E2C01_061877 [Portunus trituberculatus]|uniref:Uncharacterized protein n=1 Tax=Portunus trituberculatus TaxID=210409 RepID=A0A5B7HEG1_PORTR|nr:hypothetical protein [Portunus trituberculatus]
MRSRFASKRFRVRLLPLMETERIVFVLSLYCTSLTHCSVPSSHSPLQSSRCPSTALPLVGLYTCNGLDASDK